MRRPILTGILSRAKCPTSQAYLALSTRRPLNLRMPALDLMGKPTTSCSPMRSVLPVSSSTLFES